VKWSVMMDADEMFVDARLNAASATIVSMRALLRSEL
jgi:hypothetical protein